MCLNATLYFSGLKSGSKAPSADFTALSPPMSPVAFTVARAPSPVLGNSTTMAYQLPSEPTSRRTGPFRPSMLSSTPQPTADLLSP